ncbi:poly-gamma-glutamate hydrolase family protein [Kitasatospora sp. NPDC094015]|uniref:poly-gamma-glutamate hydrolase family protein n=1 Tax=Kitasatospora sp. NPDC094015 TaxID=3155205 RepID=UPI00331947AF
MVLNSPEPPATSPATATVTAAVDTDPAGGPTVDPAGDPVPGANDTYPSNTALYADPGLTEGVDYGRRYRRHRVDAGPPGAPPRWIRTTVIAPHGGGIEEGTSELCLAIAGYHPADLSPGPDGGPPHDFWIFDGLRAAGNAPLHVTATHCDDTVARALAAGSLNVLSVHGCSPARAGLEAGARAVLVGGLNAAFRRYLVEEFTAAGIRAVGATGQERIAGRSPENICNRTLLGMGAQLEITAELRRALFAEGSNTLALRATATLPLFWSFAGATRSAIRRLEADQPVA